VLQITVNCELLTVDFPNTQQLPDVVPFHTMAKQKARTAKKPPGRKKAAPAKKKARPKTMSLAMTGCRTLVGSGMLDRLDGFGDVERVVVFDVQPPDTSDTRVVYHQIDLTQPGAEAEMAEVMRDHDTNVFLHAAFLWNTVRDNEWAHELESVGTDRVLASVLSAGIGRLVVTSSVSVYGITHRNGTPLTEDAPLVSDRTLPPWRDKVEAEKAVSKFAESHEEVCTTVIRSALVLDHGVDRAISRILKGRFLPALMGFDPLFQFVHPDDLMNVYRRCLTEDHPGVFNVTTPDAIALSDMLSLGSLIPVTVPHFLAIPGYRVMWTAGVGDVHWSFMNFLRFSLVTDGSRAREELGFVTERTTLDTVAEFFDRKIEDRQ